VRLQYLPRFDYVVRTEIAVKSLAGALAFSLGSVLLPLLAFAQSTASCVSGFTTATDRF
jgi:hypothetical protein